MNDDTLKDIKTAIENTSSLFREIIGTDSIPVANALRKLGKPTQAEYLIRLGNPSDVSRGNFIGNYWRLMAALLSRFSLRLHP